MFRSQTMSRVELAVPERDIVAVTEVLAASGAFQPIQTSHMSSERSHRFSDNWQEQVPAFIALEQRILTVMETLDVAEGPPPTETPHLIDSEVVKLDVERLERETQVPVQELEEERQKLTQLQRQIAQLQTVAELKVSLDAVRDLRYTFAILGTMPVANLERLQTSLEFIPSVLVVLRREEHLATVALFGTQRDADILNRAARSAYLNPLTLPDTCRGTPAEVIAALKSGVERTYQHIEEYEDTIDRLHEMRVDHLRHLLWRVRASRTLAETISRYGRLRYTYLVAGWIPDSQIPSLEEEIRQVSPQALIEVDMPRRQDDVQIPISLANPAAVQGFQSLVTNYGYPGYSELDPTLMVALTFPLIFGIMFGDLGHGFVLVLLGLLLVGRVVRALRGLASTGTILIACGVVSMIFGILYGSFFGSEDFLKELLNLPFVQVIKPIEQITTILLVTVAAGAGLLSLGMVLNMVNAALARRWGHLIFGHNSLAGLVFYWSLIGFALNAFSEIKPVDSTLLLAVVIASGTAVTFSEPLEKLVEGRRPLVEGGVGTYLIQLPIELFEILIGLFSNTLSYVRMGAFAVAHGALSMVVFMIAGIISAPNSLGYWVVVAVGNLFVIGFEGMIVGIQTLRLQYYEFFSKFFSGSGTRYRPLSLIPKGKE